jgi:hypothetical protein
MNLIYVVYGVLCFNFFSETFHSPILLQPIFDSSISERAAIVNGRINVFSWAECGLSGVP